MSLSNGLKVTLATLGVLLALSVGGVGVAQAGKAPDWWVKGGWLGNGKTKAFSATSTEVTRLSVPGLSKVKLESPKGKCKMSGGEIVGNGTEAPGLKRKVTLTCLETKVAEVANCVVRSEGSLPETVVFGPMKGVLVWLNSTGQSAGDYYTAEAATGPLSVLILEGPLCSISNKYSVQGAIIAPITPVAEEANPVTQGFPDPAIQKWWNNAAPREEKPIDPLVVGAFNATLQSSYSVTLNPAEPFTVREG